MQKEILRQPLGKLDMHKGECRTVVVKESYIIASQPGKLPRLEKCRIFSFQGDGGEEIGNLIVTTRGDEDSIRRFIWLELRLSRYNRGREDPSWLIEVWA